MGKPKFNLTPTQTATTGGAPQYYDSGILYDSGRYYDRWYDADGILIQGEKPSVKVYPKQVRTQTELEKSKLQVRRTINY